LANIDRPIGVVLIALANLPIYIAVLAYAINLYFTGHSYYGSGYNLLILSTYAFVTYSVAGIIGVLCLLARWKSFRYMAMLGWIVECVIFSTIGFFGWSKGYFDSSYIITYNYRVIFLAVSIVLLKIISIAYFATKKTQASA
jgi:hypothetical protein